MSPILRGVQGFGMSDTALQTVARKLLEHTVRRDGELSLTLPSVTPIVTPTDSGDASVQVKGMYTRPFLDSPEGRKCTFGRMPSGLGILAMHARTTWCMRALR